MADPFDIKLYPQPWITYSVLFQYIEDYIAHSTLAYSLKSAQSQTLFSLTNYLLADEEFEDYDDFVERNYYGYDLSENQYQALTDFYAATAAPNAENPLSVEETETLIEHLGTIINNHRAEWQPHLTPGPWAESERAQIFDWLRSQIARYVDLEPFTNRQSISTESFPLITVWQNLNGQSEMSREAIVASLSKNADLLVEIPRPENLPPPQAMQDIFFVRLPRLLPDGSPEALGIQVTLSPQKKRGRAPLIK